MDNSLAIEAQHRHGHEQAPLWGLLLAALPHLLMCSTFFGVSVAFGGRGMPWYPYFLLAILLGGLGLAWRRNWPLWSGSWVGYGLLLVSVLLLSAVARVIPQSGRAWPLVAALTAGCVVIALRRPVHALLAALPLLAFLPRIGALEYLEGRNLVFGGVFVLLALTSALIVWRATWRTAILGAISFYLLSGLAYTAARFFLPFDLGPLSAGMDAAPRRVPANAELVDYFLPLFAAAVAASLALFVLHVAWRRLVGGLQTSLQS